MQWLVGFMSENSHVKPLSEKEIENLANSRAEHDAFVKSTVVFVGVWLVGFVTFPFVPDRHYRVYSYIVSLRILYFIASFLVAFVAGLVTRWVVKDSAYEKYYTFYKEQQKQEQGR
jgi:hypothetical protein